MLYYMPLESYKARYTSQLSGIGESGWLESRWLENQIPHCRIEPDYQVNTDITHGEVLDGCQRGIYSCLQIAKLLEFIQQGAVTSDDAIYFDDFWTPGIEALPYAFHQAKIKPKMYALLHAQSVDEFDFTFDMLPWIRHFEKGNASILDGIFVSCGLLGDLVYKQGLADRNKIYVTGLPYNKDKVKEYITTNIPNFSEIQKENQVIFTSRFDKEKNPDFFLSLAESYYEIDRTVKFVMTTSHSDIKSNMREFNRIIDKFSSLPNLTVKIGLSKTEYYKELLKSKIQFNCADQDFVSWTLLEALTCNCIPIYPNFRSFPEILPITNLYAKNNIASACIKIEYFLKKSFNEKLKDITNTHNIAWERMWHVMFSEDKDNRYSLNNYKYGDLYYAK